ncbi:hypothetical protein PILCRDRAFT_76681 [Piloderma croceum F 1598]|uniref:UbiA prenyltransferase family n=1 Tax=Piloderma croceum (strain F 1598) TaxID=765440 RepID=A0A0C3FCK4_PILCF|nr:hypothetical protein PILCRDRAFT_76681 [Piloderma croceum F 1598]
MYIARRLLAHTYTLYLFTKSDIPLVTFPMLTVAMVLAGPTDWSSFSMAFIWLELHLLVFDVKNQIIGIEEDKLSKPYRPFPSGRISLQHGQLLYLCVMASCIVISICNRLTAVSFIYMLSMWLYNEVGLSMHPISKNLLCAIGYMCYSWGTTYIIGRHQPMSSTSTTAIFLSGLIFFTTGHASDFRDRSGDAAIGRKTIPLIIPQVAARWSLLFATLAITCGLIFFWKPPMLVAAIFAVIGATTTVKFVTNYSEEADRTSCRWYEVSIVPSLPNPLS